MIFIILLVLGILIAGGYFFFRKKKEVFSLSPQSTDHNKNPYSEIFDLLLTKWHNISEKHDIPYSLAFGTYLGWVRNESYIPYDLDMDVFIDRESIDTILSLPDIYSWCVMSDQIPEDMIKDNTLTIVINSQLEKPWDDRTRHDCNGKLSDSQIDSCSFNGPFARVIYGTHMHIDVYLYNLILPDGGLLGPVSLHGEVEYINDSKTLPPVKPCTLNGVKTSVFKELNEEMLQTFYGKDYIIPNHEWCTQKKEWVKKE